MISKIMILLLISCTTILCAPLDTVSSKQPVFIAETVQKIEPPKLIDITIQKKEPAVVKVSKSPVHVDKVVEVIEVPNRNTKDDIVKEVTDKVDSVKNVVADIADKTLDLKQKLIRSHVNKDNHASRPIRKSVTIISNRKQEDLFTPIYENINESNDNRKFVGHNSGLNWNHNLEHDLNLGHSSHDLGHTPSHDLGHIPSHDLGLGHDLGHSSSHGLDHTSSHDLGHTPSHDLGLGHDLGHTSSHDLGHTPSHDLGHSSSHGLEHNLGHTLEHSEKSLKIDVGHDAGHSLGHVSTHHLGHGRVHDGHILEHSEKPLEVHVGHDAEHILGHASTHDLGHGSSLGGKHIGYHTTHHSTVDKTSYSGINSGESIHLNEPSLGFHGHSLEHDHSYGKVIVPEVVKKVPEKIVIQKTIVIKKEIPKKEGLIEKGLKLHSDIDKAVSGVINAHVSAVKKAVGGIIDTKNNLLNIIKHPFSKLL